MGTLKEEDTMEVDVAIVGGGLSGLALAVGLRERGIHAHVFEKSGEVRPHFGTGLIVGPNGMCALKGIKHRLSERFEEAGSIVRQLTNALRVQGQKETVFSWPVFATKAGKMVSIPWKRAHETLLDELLLPNLLHWRHSFVDYKIVQGGVEVRIDAGGGGGEDESCCATKVVRAKLLVGADGVRSEVRKQMVGDKPRDLCFVTWNALVPTDSIRSLELHDSGELRIITYQPSKMNLISCDFAFGWSMVQARVADKTGEITGSYASDVEAHGREARKVRALKHIEGIEELQNLKAAFECVEAANIREGRSYDRLPLSTWSDPSGHVLLIGDAAHGMYSGAAQGGRAGFEDAHQLSILLHEAFSTGSAAPESAVPDAVKRFEEVRIPRVTKIHSFAAELTTWPELIPEWAKKLPTQEFWNRYSEFFRWTEKYPEVMAGDPDSTYWKP